MSPGFAILDRLAKKWKAEAGRRKKISAVDPVADAIDYCAAELEVALKDAELADAFLTVEQYAARVQKSKQTVRGWCRKGKVPAERTPTGYIIRVAA